MISWLKLPIRKTFIKLVLYPLIARRRGFVENLCNWQCHVVLDAPVYRSCPNSQLSHLFFRTGDFHPHVCRRCSVSVPDLSAFIEPPYGYSAVLFLEFRHSLVYGFQNRDHVFKVSTKFVLLNDAQIRLQPVGHLNDGLQRFKVFVFRFSTSIKTWVETISVSVLISRSMTCSVSVASIGVELSSITGWLIGDSSFNGSALPITGK